VEKRERPGSTFGSTFLIKWLVALFVLNEYITLSNSINMRKILLVDDDEDVFDPGGNHADKTRFYRDDYFRMENRYWPYE
jgi:hypothetical protein